MITAWIHFIGKLILGLLLGLLAILYCAQRDPCIQNVVAYHLATGFEKAVNCHIAYTVKDLTFFAPSLTLHEIKATACDDAAWHWRIKECTLSFSWWHLLFRGLIHLNLNASDVQIYSEVTNNSLAIFPHIKTMITGPSEIPLFIKTLNAQKVQCTIHDTDRNRTYSLTFDSTSKKIDRTLKSQWIIHDGSFKTAAQTYCSAAQGTFSLEVPETITHFPPLHANLKISTAVTGIAQTPITLYCTGTWHDRQGTLAITSSDNQLAVHTCTVNLNSPTPVIFDAEFPLAYLTMLMPEYFIEGLTGTARIKAQSNGFTFDQWQSTIEVNNLAWHDITLCTQSSCNADKNAKGLMVEGTATCPFIGLVRINAHNANTETTHFTAYAVENISIHGIQETIPANTRLIDAQYHAGITQGSVQAPLANSSHTITGNFFYQQPQGAYEFHYADYGVRGTWSNNGMHQSTLLYQNVPVIDLMQHSGTNIMIGQTTIDHLKPLCASLLHTPLVGQGIVNAQLGYDKEYVTFNLALNDGAVRLPHTYNHLQQLSAQGTYNTTTNLLNLEHCNGSLYKGTFSLEPAHIILNPSTTYWHLPLLLDSCLITLQKGMFATVSGSFITEKKIDQSPLIRGHLIIDRAQLNEQLLSATWISSLIRALPLHASTESPDASCNITVETKEPLRVKTDMLQTTASIRLHITGSLTQPQVSGTIQLHGGSIMLPYKSLFITKALLTLNPDNFQDPLIDLMAKNSIKKHRVSLQITGSLQHPQVVLESTPPLTEDQIISLIVTGTHEDSLGAAIPALIIQHLKSLFFDTKQSPLKTADNVKQLLKPLRRVHVIPRFTDQTGRGGLRGALEIDVTDRLSVQLQKNFSLQEDTRLEVDYLLSDDISLRGVRDERKDVTGEVEMKWKF